MSATRDAATSTNALLGMYPGSFDPIHRGHMDVVEQSIEIFGRVVIMVMHNHAKQTGMFTVEDRVRLINESFGEREGLSVATFAGLAIDAAADVGADFIVKGLRTAGDFEIEQQMAHTNYTAGGVRTVYLPCRPEYGYISSRFVREIAKYGGEVGPMVPGPVERSLNATATASTVTDVTRASK